MAKIPKIVPVTDLRQDAASLLDNIQKADEPWIITQRGRATAVLLSVEAYERSQRENELLRFLAVGEKEIALGKGHSLVSVLEEADKLLANGGK
jgi:prevent-host-death family protein